MVGKPGGSRGCNTCRKRKKGCDQGRPACKRCIQAGVYCEGYESKKNIWRPSGYEIYLEKSSSPKARSDSSSSSSPENVVLEDSLVRTARSAKYLDLLWQDYVPRDVTSKTPLCSIPGWISMIQTLPETKALKLATLSMSVSYLGAQDNQPDLMLKGLQTYNQAVKEVRLALLESCSKSDSDADALLGAVNILSSYEVLFGEDPKSSTRVELRKCAPQAANWFAHVRHGEIGLILARGPMAFSTGAAFQLFSQCRLRIVAGDILRRKRSVLDDVSWKTAAWTFHSKTIKDRLVDTLLSLSSLMEDIDEMKYVDDSAMLEEFQASALASCYSISKELDELTAEAGMQVRKFDYTLRVEPLPTPTSTDDVTSLHLSHLLWSTRLLNFNTMIEASGKHVKEKDLPLGTLEEGNVYAYKIARSIHLFLAPGSGLGAFNLLLFPLGVAITYLMMTEPRDNISEEHKMLRKVFQTPFLGSYCGRFLRNLGTHEETPHFMREIHRNPSVHRMVVGDNVKVPIRISTVAEDVDMTGT